MKTSSQAVTRRIALAVLLCGLLVLTGCGPEKKAQQGPKEVLSAYIDATISGRPEEAYSLLSSRDRSEKTLQAFIAERADEESLVRNAMAKKISYTIRHVHVEGGRARATVDITAPDYDRMIRDILSTLDIRDLPRGSLDAHVHVSGLLGRHIRKYRDRGIPMRTTAEMFDLVEETGEWKVAVHGGVKK